MIKKLLTIIPMLIINIIILVSCGSTESPKTSTDSPKTSSTEKEKYVFDRIEWADDFSSAKAIYKGTIDSTKTYEIRLSQISVEKTESTCTKYGSIVCSAAVDGKTYTKNIELPLASHEYEEEVKAPTFEEKGYTRHTCKVCGYYYDDNETDKLEHNYSEKWLYTEEGHYHACIDEGFESLKCNEEKHKFNDVVVLPTYDTKGYTRHTCEVCGYYYDDKFVDELEHNYSKDWSYNETNHYHSCIDEGYEALTNGEEKHKFLVDESAIESASLDDFDFTYMDDSKTYEISKYRGTSKKIIIPSSYNGISITSIGDNAFKYNDSLETIVIGGNIDRLGDFAFYGCLNLKNVYILNKKVISIGSDEFGSTWDASDFFIYVPEYLINEYNAITADYWQFYCASKGKITSLNSQNLYDYSCSVCGYKFNKSSDETEHNYSNEWSYDEISHYHTCLDEGYESLKTDENNHNFSVSILNPTFESKGYTRHTCEVCGYYYDDSETDKLEHNYSNEWSYNETNHFHSCIDEGYEELKSNLEEHSIVDEVINPTFEDEGYIRHICSVCGYYYDDNEVEVLQHNYSKEWSCDENNHYHSCIDEGYEDLHNNQASHIYERWNVTKNPTTLEKGLKERTCSVCGYKEIEEIDILPPYKITLDLNGGTSEAITTTSITITHLDKSFFKFDLYKENYKFKGWEVNNTQVFDKNGNIVNEIDLEDNLTFKAIFAEEVTLTINYSLYNPKTNSLIKKYDDALSDFGDISKTDDYAWNTQVNLHANLNEGYTFVGWYYNGIELSSQTDYNYMMWDTNITIEARIKYTIYNLTVYSNKTDLGKVMIREGYSQVFYDTQTLTNYYTESITIVANTLTETRYLGWFNENNALVSTNAVYTFDMPNRNYILQAKWNDFLITYELNGGINDNDNPSSYDINMSNIILKNPTKEGYTFVGWYYNNELITEINIQNKCDMLIEARWECYTLTTQINNSKAGTITEYCEKKITSGDEVTIIAVSNPGYTWIGWYDENNQLTDELSYTFNMPSKSITYEARWNANTNTSYKVEHYKQNIEDDEYTLFETDNLTGTTDTLTEGEVNVYKGFASPTISQANIDGDGSRVIKLYYIRNKYIVDLNRNNTNAGIVSGAGSIKYEKEITIEAITNPGYTFNGWYMNGELYNENSSFILNVGVENVSFEARWTTNKYAIIIDNQAEGATITGITSGNEYECNSLLTLTASNIPSGYTARWSRSDDIVYSGNTYSFNVPAETITITITTRPYTRNNNVIYFGTYPQNRVTNENLINELNGLSGSLPTSNMTYNWTDYNYYILSNVTSYMYYQDIDYDNDGTYDYRGVYFTQYRPYIFSNGSTTYSSNGYNTNTIYWFSYQPVRWKILSEENGKAFLIADLILDSQEFYPSDSSSAFSHNDGTGYANNYELSQIRKFLNEVFYNTAFNESLKSLIETTTVDNSATSSISDYACNNTEDKIFLLSYKEAKTYFISDVARETNPSEYARCQGCSVYGSWWLRSPDDYSASCAYYVQHDGNVSNASYYGYRTYLDVGVTSCGIRPACWITL